MAEKSIYRIKKSYRAEGIVLGNLWLGGSGGYPAQKITGHSKSGLLKKAEKMLEDGSLDSGMGFESLKGALLDVIEVSVLTLGGEEFTREDRELEYIGELTREEKQSLNDWLFSGY